MSAQIPVSQNAHLNHGSKIKNKGTDQVNS
jgi:hypothetical protein